MTDELTKVVQDSARGGFFLFSGTALATVIMAIASILIGRLLESELYGQYTLALVVPQILFLFTDLGISNGIIRFTASLRTQGETTRIAAMIRYGLVLRALAGIAISIIGYTFADSLVSFLIQRPDLAFPVQIASISILFQAIFTTATSAFVGLDRSEYNALSTNIQAISKTTVSIALVLLGFSVTGAIIGHTVSFVVAAAASMIMLLALLRQRKGKEDGQVRLRDDLRTLIHYGAPLYASLLLTGFIPLYKYFVLAQFCSDPDIGNYKAAANFVTLMTVLSVPITTILLPAFSKLDSSAKQGIRAFFKLANKYTAIIVVPTTFLMIILSNEIIQVVYGHTYQSAPLFLSVFCLQYFLVGLGYLTLASFFNGLGKTRITLAMSAIACLAVILLAPVFTQTYGVPGVILSFLLASSASTGYGSYVARRKFQVEFGTPSIIKVYLVSAACGIPTFLLLHFANLPLVLDIVIGGCIYLFCYVTVMPLVRIMTATELQNTMQITNRIPGLAFLAGLVLKYQRKIMNARADTE
jgi:O-antigen/teichoic acid export membrane protein